MGHGNQRPEIKLVRAFMPVLITSNFDDDLIKNKWASMETPFSHYKSMGNFYTSRAANSVVSGPIWPKFELVWNFMHVHITCKYKKDRIKNNWEKVETPVLETACRIVAKCDQTLVWATKFIAKDRPENEFGRPDLGRGYRKFSAYLRSTSEINLFQIARSTWGNNIVFLPKDAAIILTGSSQFSATCCLFLFSKRTFSRTWLTV